MLRWNITSSFIIFGCYLLVTRGFGTSALSCLKCNSRDHASCINLESRVLMQECYKNEVCGKFTFFKTAPSTFQAFNEEIVGIIRDCVKYDPKIGFNECVRVEVGVRPGDKCFCNDTDLCNGTGGSRHKRSFHNNHIVVFLTAAIILYSWFMSMA